MNITNITPPRVPFIDDRTGLISREWYRFFLNLFVLTGSGQNDTTITDLAVAPQSQDFSGELAQGDQDARLGAMMARFDELSSMLDPTSFGQPRVQVGTIAAQNSDRVSITGGRIGLFAGSVSAPSYYMQDAGTGLYRIGTDNWGFSVNGTNLWNWAATSAILTGDLKISAKFACNGATPQAAAASSATASATGNAPAGGAGVAAGGWSSAADRDTAITAINDVIAKCNTNKTALDAVITALKNNGIMS